MYWQLHVARLALLGRMPFGNPLRRFKRRAFGYKPNLSNLRDTHADFRKMEAELARHGRSFAGATVLEIGTGWFPTIPLMLCLHGAKNVVMTDLTPHLDALTFKAALDFLRTQGEEFKELGPSSNIGDYPLTYLAPLDLRKVPDGSLDCVVSRTVLEHIPEPALVQLFEGLRAKLSPTGCMVHCVDHSDHLAHQDKRLSMVNFLSWPQWQHSLVNWLTKEGENRLRHSDYLQLFDRTGYQVLSDKSHVHPASEAALRTLELAPQFQGRSPTELATLVSYYVLAPKASAGQQAA